MLHQRYIADAVGFFFKNSPFYRLLGMILLFTPTSSFQSVQIICTCITEPSTAAQEAVTVFTQKGLGQPRTFLGNSKFFFLMCFAS